MAGSNVLQTVQWNLVHHPRSVLVFLLSAAPRENVKAVAWNRNRGTEEEVPEAGPERCAFT